MKKRTFLVAGLALLISSLIAVMLGMYASSLLGPGVLHRFSLNQQPLQSNLQGAGVNICSVKPSNLIRDGSFEAVTYNHFLTVYSGDGSTVAVSSEDASQGGLYTDDFFVGAEARIMTIGTSGLRVKKQAEVSSFILNQPGIFQPVRLPADLPENFGINTMAIIDTDTVIAAGSAGTVLTIENYQTTALSYTGSDKNLVAIDSNGKITAVLSEDGEIFITYDGYSWLSVFKSNKKLNDIAVSEDGMIAAVGNDGVIVSGRSGNIELSYSPTKQDMLTVSIWSDGWLAAGNDMILYSKGGVIWRPLHDETNSVWRDIEAADGEALIAGSKGNTAIISGNASKPVIEVFQDTSIPDLVAAMRIENDQYICLDKSGNYLLSNDGGRSFRRSEIDTGIVSKNAVYAGEGKIVAADEDGRLAQAQLVAGISLDSRLQEGVYQAGDLIYLSKTDHTGKNESIEGDSGYWQTDDSSSVRRVLTASAPAGEGYLEISSQENVVISQLIALEDFREQLEDNVIRFSGWVFSEQTSLKLNVWIEGLNRDISTSFELTSGEWRRYSYSFIIPETWLQNEDIKLHIGISGAGKVMLDDLKLSAAGSSDQGYADSFISDINRISPDIMRFSFVPIGSIEAPFEAWSVEPGQAGFVYTQESWTMHAVPSLSSALELASSTNAAPWLKIDSAASEEELMHLFEYLAAPVSEPYGRLRMEQGRAVPWTETFTRIYIEIADDNGLLTNDRVKSAYTNWVIEQISQTPYYIGFKHRLVFVDAMDYSQDLMFSSADYHASEIKLDREVAKIYEFERLYAGYWSNIPRNPEKMDQDWPEMIRSMKVIGDSDEHTLAGLVSALTYDLGGQTGLALIDRGCNESTDVQLAYTQIDTAANLISRAAVGHPYKISRLSDSDNVFVFATSSNSDLRVLLSNSSSMPATCQLVTDDNLVGAVLSKYDSQGKLIGTEKIRRNEGHITVLPGGVVYLEKLDSQ